MDILKGNGNSNLQEGPLSSHLLTEFQSANTLVTTHMCFDI